MSLIIVRKATMKTEGDLETIVDFQQKMAKETEDLHLEREKLLLGVKSLLEGEKSGSYYLAVQDEKIIGCTLVLDEWSDWRNATVWWIHSVYIIPEARRLGVFSTIYSYLKHQVEERKDLAGLRLYVDKRNTKAQRVYEKLGMSQEHYELFEWLKD